MYYVGQTLDLEGATVNYYADDSKSDYEPFALTEEMIEGFDSASVGEDKTMIITYQNLTTEITYMVIDPYQYLVDVINFSNSQQKVKYERVYEADNYCRYYEQINTHSMSYFRYGIIKDQQKHLLSASWDFVEYENDGPCGTSYRIYNFNLDSPFGEAPMIFEEEDLYYYKYTDYPIFLIKDNPIDLSFFEGDTCIGITTENDSITIGLYNEEYGNRVYHTIKDGLIVSSTYQNYYEGEGWTEPSVQTYTYNEAVEIPALPENVDWQ